MEGQRFFLGMGFDRPLTFVCMYVPMPPNYVATAEFGTKNCYRIDVPVIQSDVLDEKQ